MIPPETIISPPRPGLDTTQMAGCCGKPGSERCPNITAAAMLWVAALDCWPCSCKGLSKVLFPLSLWPKWVRGSGAWWRCRPAREAGPGGRLWMSEATNEGSILSPSTSQVHSFSVGVRKGSRARGGGCGNLRTTLPLCRAPGVPT